jgi:hypothetical protein
MIYNQGQSLLENFSSVDMSCIRIIELKVSMLLPFGSRVHYVLRDPREALHGIRQ